MAHELIAYATFKVAMLIISIKNICGHENYGLISYDTFSDDQLDDYGPNNDYNNYFTNYYDAQENLHLYERYPLNMLHQNSFVPSALSHSSYESYNYVNKQQVRPFSRPEKKHFPKESSTKNFGNPHKESKFEDNNGDVPQFYNTKENSTEKPASLINERPSVKVENESKSNTNGLSVNKRQLGMVALSLISPEHESPYLRNKLKERNNSLYATSSNLFAEKHANSSSSKKEDSQELRKRSPIIQKHTQNDKETSKEVVQPHKSELSNDNYDFLSNSDEDESFGHVQSDFAATITERLENGEEFIFDIISDVSKLSLPSVNIDRKPWVKNMTNIHESAVNLTNTNNTIDINRNNSYSNVNKKHKIVSSFDDTLNHSIVMSNSSMLIAGIFQTMFNLSNSSNISKLNTPKEIEVVDDDIVQSDFSASRITDLPADGPLTAINMFTGNGSSFNKSTDPTFNTSYKPRVEDRVSLLTPADIADKPPLIGIMMQIPTQSANPVTDQIVSSDVTVSASFEDQLVLAANTNNFVNEEMYATSDEVFADDQEFVTRNPNQGHTQIALNDIDISNSTATEAGFFVDFSGQLYTTEIAPMMASEEFLPGTDVNAQNNHESVAVITSAPFSFAETSLNSSLISEQEPLTIVTATSILFINIPPYNFQSSSIGANEEHEPFVTVTPEGSPTEPFNEQEILTMNNPKNNSSGISVTENDATVQDKFMDVTTPVSSSGITATILDDFTKGFTKPINPTIVSSDTVHSLQFDGYTSSSLTEDNKTIANTITQKHITSQHDLVTTRNKPKLGQLLSFSSTLSVVKGQRPATIFTDSNTTQLVGNSVKQQQKPVTMLSNKASSGFVNPFINFSSNAMEHGNSFSAGISFISNFMNNNKKSTLTALPAVTNKTILGFGNEKESAITQATIIINTDGATEQNDQNPDMLNQLPSILSTSENAQEPVDGSAHQSLTSTSNGNDIHQTIKSKPLFIKYDRRNTIAVNENPIKNNNPITMKDPSNNTTKANVAHILSGPLLNIKAETSLPVRNDLAAENVEFSNIEFNDGLGQTIVTSKNPAVGGITRVVYFYPVFKQKTNLSNGISPVNPSSIVTENLLTRLNGSYSYPPARHMGDLNR